MILFFFSTKGDHMSLLKQFMSILMLWRTAFCKEEAFMRSQEHAIASLCSFGRRTITNYAILFGREHIVPTADYKLYTYCKWKVEDLFDPILKLSLDYFEDSEYITLAADDTKLHKTGKKIPHTSWHRDPMSPPFHTNFIWGLRFLQYSVLLPLYNQASAPCRSIPIRFIEAPPLKRPGKRSTEEEKVEYKKMQKSHNLSCMFIKGLRDLRMTLSNMGFYNKKILMTVDGGYCNSTCFSADIPMTELIARCRKDAKLCKRYQGSGIKFYDDKKFTPEEVRKDESIPWQEKLFFYGGEWRLVRYKEVNHVLWQRGAKRRSLRLIILAPIPYVRGGKRHYRDPAYLLTTDVEGSISALIQGYLDHWQIEYNHRDEKSIIGVGQAQVRNEKSVYKQPGLHVAAYSALLMASVKLHNDQGIEEEQGRPRWRKKAKRNTCRALIGELRGSLLDYPEEIFEMGLSIGMISAILRKAA
jgi:hypothetical protein